MPSLRTRWTALCLVAAISLLVPTLLPAQGTGGRILGRISDPSGAVIAHVKVVATNEATGVTREAQSNDSGDYAFPEVPVGVYTLSFELTGFKKDLRHSVSLDLNQVVTLNMVMQIGQAQEVVDVTSEAPLVDTTSTQLGAVMDSQQVSNLPLNSRDTYQLLQLQPGVMSTIGSSNTLIYGSDSPGAVSVNGGRGRANNFSVNGGDANDLFVNLPTVQPSPDSIQEFRVLTNTFDAEYGRNSGSVINVVTKSGSNAVHGDLAEFFRNKVLNANNYCLTEAEGLPCVKPQFNQNQFGGTIMGRSSRTGGFFVSYEGRLVRQGILSPVVTVPSSQERPSPTNVVNGQIVADFTDVNAPGTFAGVLTNSSILTSRPGCQAANYAVNGPTATIQDGAPYGASIAGNPPPVFPNSQIPLACMDPTAVDLLQYVPTAPNNGSLITTTPVKSVRGDQFTVKIDHRLTDRAEPQFLLLLDDDRNLQPFANFELTGADVPGFGSILAERIQQWNLTHSWTITNNTVNEFRFNYNREGQQTFQHPEFTGLIQNTCPAAPAWQTTVTGPVPCFYGDASGNPLGIHPFLGAQREGLPFISISGGFSIGNDSEGELPQTGNSFQWSDTLTKVRGPHTFKFPSAPTFASSSSTSSTITT